MATSTPIGSVRDITPNRAIQLGSMPVAGATSIQVMGGDIARPNFTPVPGGIHTVAVAAAGRTWTIDDTTVPLPYDLKVGEGFWFIVQNNGANTITLAAAGGTSSVTAGAGTLTVATGTSRFFMLCRVPPTSPNTLAHVLTTFGTLTH